MLLILLLGGSSRLCAKPPSAGRESDKGAESRLDLQGMKKEDEICTSAISSSTIPITSGIEEAPQLLL
jgi:hypothetical protein